MRALARSDAARARVEALGATAVLADLDGEDAPLAAGLEGVELVVHAAALVTDWGPLERFRAVNVEGTRRLLALARAAGVACFVHVGTEAILADGRPIVGADESRPPPPRPLGPYPISKAEAEALVRAASDASMRTVVVRPRFVWGKDDSSLLPRFVALVQAGQYAWIDHGRYPTSTCHVDNLVEGVLLAAERGRGGEAYFLTDGPPIELRAFVGRMIESRGLEVPTRSVPRGVAFPVARICEWAWTWLPLGGAPPLTRSALALMAHEVTVDDAKARRELGYRGAVDREAGLADLARWA